MMWLQDTFIKGHFFLLLIKPPLKETMIKSARADGERFCSKLKFGKRRNTGCISSFTNCKVGAKDPSAAAGDLFSVSSRGGGTAKAVTEGWITQCVLIQLHTLHPSVKNQRFLTAPLKGEPFCASPAFSQKSARYWSCAPDTSCRRSAPGSGRRLQNPSSWKPVLQ